MSVLKTLQTYDDAQRSEAEKKGDRKGVYKYSAESEMATMRMDDLKTRVKKTEDKVFCTCNLLVDFIMLTEGVH